ncbi:hypothetical protein BDV96DRAFT_600170 [Lophiotrema nucula]|uniref:NAD(P)-binding protein n=1 Tax=Lophiotrema nucula TaxID=690887 RepID=A0A6A5Z787_9PLEO|nr:hypothetical protein BDV96DRAFT_600170 [Lophiotrema nucula]
MSSQKTIVVFGSGPGIGNHTAAEFASKGFTHVILLARSKDRLPADAAQVSKAVPGVKVDTLTIDLANLSSIPDVLKKIDGLAPSPEVVFFNAARIKMTPNPLAVPVEEIDEDFKTTNLALHIVAQHYIPKLKGLAESNPAAKPSLLVTNSHLPWDPAPPLLSLSLVKASQRNMVINFNRAFSGAGVHAALVTVEGQVAPANKSLNPKNIAEKTYGLYEDGKVLEVNIKE